MDDTAAGRNTAEITRRAPFQRLALITGGRALSALERSSVIIVGLGGVGSWCAEALARSGVGRLTLIDSDVVCVTNINRQVQALPGTIGRFKADALRTRLLQIHPECAVTVFNTAFDVQNASSFGIEQADYVIDAIDTLSCKVALIEAAARAGTTLYSSMGMAQKLDPTRIKTADIWETHGCPLARLVRSELRRRNFTGHFTAVYSTERLPLRPEIEVSCGSESCLCPAAGGAREWCRSKKVINGSAVPVTAAAGMALASLVLQDICCAHWGKEAGSV